MQKTGLARHSVDWGGAKRESPCRFHAVRGSPVPGRRSFPPRPPGVPPHALPRALPRTLTPLPPSSCTSPHTHVPSAQGLAHVSCQGPHGTGFGLCGPEFIVHFNSVVAAPEPSWGTGEQVSVPCPSTTLPTKEAETEFDPGPGASPKSPG